MQGRNLSDDELARRRESRRAKSQAGGAMQDPDVDEDEDEEMPKFTWSDTLAMIIAAYQVLLPMFFAMIGTILVAYFLFKWMFS